MTDNMLKSLVTEAVSLDREINEKIDRLKELKAELIAEARSREGELASTDSGGRRWTAEGSDGCIARVNFPAPTLKAKIDEEGNVIERIKNRGYIDHIAHRSIDVNGKALILHPRPTNGQRIGELFSYRKPGYPEGRILRFRIELRRCNLTSLASPCLRWSYRRRDPVRSQIAAIQLSNFQPVLL